jgi:hypothetical protein
MLQFREHTVTTETGEPLTIRVPSGPMPSETRVAHLSACFDRVKNPDHWKKPIDIELPGSLELSEVGDILEAIEFYTATSGRAVYTATGVRFTAPGYYAGPAN